MKRKSIFLDVDGTLVSGHATMNFKVVEAINRARQNGHYVFICTGRNKTGIKYELAKADFDGIIASAGSYIEIDNKVIHSVYFNKLLVDKISKVFDENNIYYNYECTDVTYMSKKMVELFIGGVNFESGNIELEKMMQEEFKKFSIQDLSLYNNQDIHKICFIATDKNDVERAKKQLGDDVNMVIHDIFDATTINGELISKVDNKATAIKQVIDYLGIDKKDTIAFGDSMNDYEMINFVECGIAMGNACKELKEAASRVCKSVDEDGIYYEFIELGLI
ncbi:Cof-type HAD-IIB family hydrolase [Thomasclavelia spiroformis]|uniref:Cof-type HAD-IIB family hydrolase n=1 Tax=Thomasclavelia spiroformis TaxID=29348 RepID=UPI000B367147|nr:Cof-type HAD-IIB family hydrolase [Thomasclavelia spiroformis]OUO70077.1 hydrolase [Thomasclavelia spiroformis]